MTALPQGIDWGRILAATGQGLMQAGQPGGNFGQGLMQGAQFYDQGKDRKKESEFRDFQIQQAQAKAEADRLANTEAAAAKQRQQDFINGLGQGPMAAGDAQTASGPMNGGGIDPRILEFAQAFPDQAPGVLKDALAAPKPQGASSSIGKLKEDLKNGLIDQPTYDALVKKETYIAPQGGGDGLWSPYIDPKSGRTGQKNSKTGKIDWDPGNTMMVQTGTDQNGNPIYDMVSTSAGKPPSESNIQAGIRGTLIEGAIKNIRDITTNSKDISPLRMAAADTIGEKGPLGAYGANILRTDNEKKYSAAVAKGVEGLVAAITGAGVAKDQFPRIQNLIPGPTDSPEIVNWKLDQLGPILDVLLAGSGPLALAGDKKPVAPNATATPATPATGGEIHYDATGKRIP